MSERSSSQESTIQHIMKAHTVEYEQADVTTAKPFPLRRGVTVSTSLWQFKNHDADRNAAHYYFSRHWRGLTTGPILKPTHQPPVEYEHADHGNEASNEADVLLASWTADVVNFCLVIGLFEQRFQLFRRTSSATSSGWQACCGVVMEGL
ncbi:hypothetical protein T08_9224 [Trichinella sp. T8]|nr:hypothetical protein T08_9224 [Trichinella sp. T8]